METFVNQLLCFEQQAKIMLEQARAGAEQIMEELELEKLQLADEYTHKAQKHLQAVREGEDQQNRQLELELSERTKRLCDEMERQFIRNCQTWQDEIFQRCTGGRAV